MGSRKAGLARNGSQFSGSLQLPHTSQDASSPGSPGGSPLPRNLHLLPCPVRNRRGVQLPRGKRLLGAAVRQRIRGVRRAEVGDGEHQRGGGRQQVQQALSGGGPVSTNQCKDVFLAQYNL